MAHRSAALRLSAGLVAALAAVSGALGTSPAAREGARYLADQQGDDGSVPAGWRADQVAEAVIALVAGGGESDAVGRAVEFLAAKGPAAASSGPFTGRIVSGLVAAGQDPRTFGGVDYVARLESFHVAGSYGGQGVYADTLAMLGLLAAGRTLPDEVITRLVVNQCADGGWSHREGCLDDPDTDTTAMAVSVLAAARGAGAEEVREGRAWLLNTQGSSGCWGLQAGDVGNANSCGLALSAVAGLGEDRDAPPWTDDERRPVETLRDLQLPSGGFRYRADVAGANPYATIQAVPGVAGWPYPVSAPPPEDPSPTPPTSGGSRPEAPPSNASRRGGETTGAAPEGTGPEAVPVVSGDSAGPGAGDPPARTPWGPRPAGGAAPAAPVPIADGWIGPTRSAGATDVSGADDGVPALATAIALALLTAAATGLTRERRWR